MTRGDWLAFWTTFIMGVGAGMVISLALWMWLTWPPA